MPRIHFLSALLLALCLSGCHCDNHETAAASIATVSRDTEFVKTELYFGLSKPGGTVSASEWNKFLDEQVTPSFKDGLTVVDGKGQWLNQAGVVTKEGS